MTTFDLRLFVHEELLFIVLAMSQQAGAMNGQPQRTNHRGTLQNGYQLQHYYRIGQNALTDSFKQAAEQLRQMSNYEFQARAQQSQQWVNSPRYRLIVKMRRQSGAGSLNPLGIPEPPDLDCLVAMGDRDHAVAVIEQWVRDYTAWEERTDPGGLAEEQQLELLDRGCTESKLKRKRKRQQQQGYCVLQ